MSSLSSKKRMKTSWQVVKLNLFVHYLEETLAWENHFEFFWPFINEISLILKPLNLFGYFESEIFSGFSKLLLVFFLRSRKNKDHKCNKRCPKIKNTTTVKDRQKITQNVLGEHKVITTEQQFLGVILSFFMRLRWPWLSRFFLHKCCRSFLIFLYIYDFEIKWLLQ